MALIDKLLLESKNRCDVCGRKFTTRIPVALNLIQAQTGRRRGVEESIVVCKEAAEELAGLSSRSLFLAMCSKKSEYKCPKPRGESRQIESVKPKEAKMAKMAISIFPLPDDPWPYPTHSEHRASHPFPISIFEEADALNRFNDGQKINTFNVNRVEQAFQQGNLKSKSLLMILDRASELRLPEKLIQKLKIQYESLVKREINQRDDSD